MLNFQINDFLSLRLENGRTMIYVKDRPFSQCMYLLLNVSVSKVREYDQIRSIDEAAEVLNRSMEGHGRSMYDITPEAEFWGHCSNIQAWAENNYNTCILHRNLAFPLLKRMVEVGDQKAKQVFKEEIAVRFSSGHPTVMLYLLNEGYLRVLNHEEINTLMESLDGDLFRNQSLDMLFRVFQQIERLGYINGKKFIKEQIKYRFEQGIAQDINQFIHLSRYYYYRRYFNYFNKEELAELFNRIDLEQLKTQNIRHSFPVLKYLDQMGNTEASRLIIDKVIISFREKRINDVRYIIKNQFLNRLEPSQLEELFNESLANQLLNPNDKQTFNCIKWLPHFIISKNEYLEFLKAALSGNYFVYKTDATVQLIENYFEVGYNLIERIFVEFNHKVRLPVIEALINVGSEKGDELLNFINWSKLWYANRLFLTLDNKRITAERAHNILIQNNFRAIKIRNATTIYEYSSFNAFSDLNDIIDQLNQNKIVEFDILEQSIARDARIVLPALPVFDIDLGEYKKFSITLRHSRYFTEIYFNDDPARNRNYSYYYRANNTKNLRDVLNRKEVICQEALRTKSIIMQRFYDGLNSFRTRLEKYYRDCEILKRAIKKYLSSTEELSRIRNLKIGYREKELEDFRKVYPSTFKPTYNKSSNTLTLYEAHKWGKYHADSNIKVHESGVVIVFVNTFVNYSKRNNYHNAQVYFFFPKLQRFYTRKANMVRNLKDINNWDLSITNLFGYDYLKRRESKDEAVINMSSQSLFDINQESSVQES